MLILLTAKWMRDVVQKMLVIFLPVKTKKYIILYLAHIKTNLVCNRNVGMKLMKNVNHKHNVTVIDVKTGISMLKTSL